MGTRLVGRHWRLLFFAACAGAFVNGASADNITAAAPVPALTAPQPPSLVRTLEQLNEEMSSYLRTPNADSAGRLNQSLAEISALMGSRETDAGSQSLIQDKVQALTNAVENLMAHARKESESRTRMRRLQQQARSTLVALALNQRASTSEQPPSLSVVNEIAQEQARLESADQGKAASLAGFFESARELKQLLDEQSKAAERASEPRPRPQMLTSPAPSAIPGPRGIGGLLLLAAAILGSAAVAELIKKRMWIPVERVIRAMEAAAAGDLSGHLEWSLGGRAGQLVKAFNRLLAVLSRSEKLVYQLSTLVDSSSEAIIGLDLEGKIVSWNKGAQRIYGYGNEEVRGQAATLLTPHVGADRMIDIVERAKRGERVQPIEMIQEGRNGRPAHVFLRVAALLDTKKTVIGVSLWAQDMTGERPFPSKANDWQPSQTQPNG